MRNEGEGLAEMQPRGKAGGVVGRRSGTLLIERNLMMPTRDGVLLATDVYRPSGSGSFPVILERTPYDKTAPSRSERTAAAAAPRSRAEVAAYFAACGYAVVY